ncbi:dTDP-4-amino-4,6-dideoxygalactose transaminase [Acetonema longum]|uniref:TDP-4-oxo-6-deoxy-D-glucose transaminase n=1 Tax=Acetonema longum DSM 6540 TaxID=1009370 RepID=F7NNW0_9FIRM|nr:dTDP-4-amino-4,6-dideoxygalactose transaminase [Acetonema longum]EGO62294.1 TDP-4-oxo-6-deoxy-D-glucose transaminase [Acetonema longum DSM 6540]
MLIRFNKPYSTGNEHQYMTLAMQNHKLSGDGDFTKKCCRWLEQHLQCRKALLTHSCTAALEMAAMLADIRPGDEVIMPSYTFVSTANAFVMRGGIPVFVDIRPDTLNIDEAKMEAAITDRTKAIVVVHYAGVACDMDPIMALAAKYSLIVIEDAAQGIMSGYKGRPLGSVGHLAALSFHDTKNITSGEGGALLINDSHFIDRAEIIWEKGTNRSRFFRGQVDKYTWVDIGSSFLPSELNAAYLWAQLECASKITQARLNVWHEYHERLQSLERAGHIRRPVIPDGCAHNAHMYYLLVQNLDVRTRLIDHLQSKEIYAVFHYVPLHNSPAGLQYGKQQGELKQTEHLADCLVRLPLWVELTNAEIQYITDEVRAFFDH